MASYRVGFGQSTGKSAVKGSGITASRDNIGGRVSTFKASDSENNLSVSGGGSDNIPLAQSQPLGTDVSPMARAGESPIKQQSVIKTPTGFSNVSSRFSPQSGITAADITQRGEAARADALQKVKEQEYMSTQQGYEATQGMQLSPYSQKAYGITQAASEKLKTRGTELKASGSYLSGYGLTSVGNVVEMAGMVPGGVETVIKRPEVIKPALVTAAISVPTSTATQLKEDPIQLVSDLAVFSALGYGAGEAGGFVKAKTPKIVPRSTPQEFLVRTELPTAPKTTVEAPTYTQLEYINQMTGKGRIFKEVKEPSLIQKPKSQPTMDVLIGKETQPGFQEVFFKASSKEAAEFAKIYEGNIRQVRTPEGSAIEFTPTGKRAVTEPILKGSEQRIGTLEPQLIGELSAKAGKKFQNPFRLEKRVEATPGKISLTPAERMVRDADVFETFGKQPLGKERQIPEYGTLEINPTPEQVRAAQIISGGIKPGYEQLLVEAYEPVFGRMGTSIKRSGIDVSIIPDIYDTWIGKEYISGIAGITKSGSTHILLRESTSPFAIGGTFPHEIGHIMAKGGMRDSLVFGKLKSEAIAEATRIKAEGIFSEIYGIKPLPRTVEATGEKYAKFVKPKMMKRPVTVYDIAKPMQPTKYKNVDLQDVFKSPIVNVPSFKSEISPLKARTTTKFKESTSKDIFKTDLERIIKQSEAYDIKAAKTPTPSKASMPVFVYGIGPSMIQGTKAIPDTRIKQITGSILSVKPVIDTTRIYDIAPITKTDTSVKPVPYTSLFNQYSKTSVSSEFNYIPTIPEVIPYGKKKPKSTKKINKKAKGKFKDIVNPVAEWEAFAKGLMK